MLEGVAGSKVSSQILEASSLRQMEEEGRLRLHLWTVLNQKVLEHRLLNVPLGKFLPLSGPRFLCEAPALHLRLRSLIPSHRCIDLCLGWLREASGSGQAVSGWREGCCWGNQALSRVRALDPTREFAAVADSHSRPRTLRSCCAPIPDLVGAYLALVSLARGKLRMTASCMVKGSSFGASQSLGNLLAP